MSKPRWTIGSILAVLSVGIVAFAQPAGPPITAIKVVPEPGVFKGAKWNKPIEIKSADDAAKYFGKDALETVKKQVDFTKQIVLVFAWSGSGGDKLDFAVAESFPEQIFFRLKQGLTRDLRQHSHVYVLRSNVRWSAAPK